MLGLYALFYAMLHLATYIFLFSGYDLPTVWEGVRAGHLGAVVERWKAVWPSIYSDLEKRRFIQVGFFAWVLLLALAVTSPRFMLRWMGGRAWRRVHSLVYVAAIAGCIHYWWQVKPGVRSPMPFTLVLAALLLVRAGWFVRRRWMERRRRLGTV